MKFMLDLVRQLTATGRFELEIDDGDSLRLLDNYSGLSVNIVDRGMDVNVYIAGENQSTNYRTTHADVVVNGIIKSLDQYKGMSRLDILVGGISKHYGLSIDIYSEIKKMEVVPEIQGGTKNIPLADTTGSTPTVLYGAPHISTASTHVEEGLDLGDLSLYSLESTDPNEDNVEEPVKIIDEPTAGTETPVEEPKDEEPTTDLEAPVEVPKDEELITETPVEVPKDEEPITETPVEEPKDEEPTTGAETPVEVPKDEEPITETEVPVSPVIPPVYGVIMKADFDLLLPRGKKVEVNISSILGNYISIVSKYNGIENNAKFPYDHSINSMIRIFKENVQSLVAIH